MLEVYNVASSENSLKALKIFVNNEMAELFYFPEESIKVTDTSKDSVLEHANRL